MPLLDQLWLWSYSVRWETDGTSDRREEEKKEEDEEEEEEERNEVLAWRDVGWGA